MLLTLILFFWNGFTRNFLFIEVMATNHFCIWTCGLFSCFSYECFNITIFDSKDINDTSTFQDTTEKIQIFDLTIYSYIKVSRGPMRHEYSERLAYAHIYRVSQKFGIKVYWRLQFLGYLRTLSLKFQKARTKIEVVLSLPSWLSQLNWDSYQVCRADSGQLQFWSEPSEILNLRSSNTPETVAFSIPWYLEV